MGEGMYRLGAVETPFDQDRVAQAIVRVWTPIYFIVTVFEDREHLQAFAVPPADRPMSSGRKVFLEEGVVLWYVGFTAGEIRGFVDRLSPMYFEVARAFREPTTLPAQRVVRMEGGAAAFCVGDGDLFLTNYHVAREEIEAQYRTAGAVDPTLCRYLRAERGSQVVLVCHPSQDGWKAGEDWALLRLRDSGADPLTPTDRRPEIGEPVWSFGFPLRSRRGAAAYPDAAGDLRLSRGVVTGLDGEHRFATDLDGFSGSSGGPVLDAGGRVLGVVQAVHPAGEQGRRAATHAGGMLCVRLDVLRRRGGPLASGSGCGL